MADEEYDNVDTTPSFEDRWDAQTVDDTADPQAAQKAELLRMLAIAQQSVDPAIPPTQGNVVPMNVQPNQQQIARSLDAIQPEEDRVKALQMLRESAQPQTRSIAPSDVPDLPQPDYTDKGGAAVKMLSAMPTPGKTFSPEVERSIEMAAKMHNIDPNILRGYVSVESSGVPTANINRPTQYKGLMQLGREEWNKFGEGKDVYDAMSNMMGGAKLMAKNRDDFARTFGRMPTPAELYLVHQQGLGFFTKGTMTNIAGNLPPDARTPENMTHQGFQDWWTNRINRAIAERGSAPTMRKVADSGLPAGYMYPGPFADVGGGPLTQGGLAETPQAQAMISELMTGKPVAEVGGLPRAVQEAAGQPTTRPQISPRVPVSREQRQVPGELPLPPGVNQTDTMPIPGIQTPGEAALSQATGPSLYSTIMNYQALQPQPLKPPPPVQDQINQPSFMDKLKAISKIVSPLNWTAEGLGTAAKVATGATQAFPQAVGEAGVQIPQGVLSGLQNQPMQVVSGVLTPAVGAAGLLTDSDTLKTAAAQGAANAEAWRQASQARVGINPEDVKPAQAAGQFIGENLGPGIAKTGINALISGIGGRILPPAADWLAKNAPIPSINPITPAHAASVFGNPPLVINTPGGPVVYNDASLNGLVWGGVLAVGFGLGISQSSKIVRAAKESPLLFDTFDPRRTIPGAPGTEAASIATDVLKGGIVDSAQMLLDVADRQKRYEQRVYDRGLLVGIDPIAADAVRQKWRYQTGSGAQNLVTRAIVDGKLTTDDFRFDVPVSIGKLNELAQAKPQFPEYLKMRAIVDELASRAAARQKLPVGSAKVANYPNLVTDHNDVTWDLAKARGVARKMEQDNPEFTSAYADYGANLAATRDFVTGIHNNGIEDVQALTTAALKNRSLPIFSSKASPRSILDQILAGDSPLSIAETNMRRAMTEQMSWDAEKNYMDLTTRAAFTPRTKEWVRDNGATAKNVGAVLRRRVGGQIQYWTADPLLVSVMNSGHMPLSGMEKTAATFKGAFQTTTTGVAAPWFAPTGGIRAMEQGWTNAPVVFDAQGRMRVAAGPFGTLAAIPAQITPRALHLASPTVAWFENHMQNSMLGQRYIDPKYHNLMSRAMEKAYNESFYKRMRDAGAYTGQTLEQDRVIHSNITQQRLANTNPAMDPIHRFMENSSNAWLAFTENGRLPIPQSARTITKMANESLRAIQEAPNFAWAYKIGKTATATERPTIKGRPMSDPEIAARMRNYTGDPSTRGFIYSQNLKGGQETLRFQGPNKGMANLYTSAAVGAHWARAVTPWAGVLVQSPASTLAAMRDNPVRANLAFAASHVMPETVAYMWNAYHSTPENDYVNYMMYGRGDNALLNNTYFAIPGKKPWEGVEFRNYQEGVFSRYMTRAWWDQFYGKSMTNMWEDVQSALRGFVGAAVLPPQPSFLSAMYGMNNMVAPEGFLGGVYKRKNNPYITLGGGESTTELVARALIPSLTDMFQQAMMAGQSAPTWADVPLAAAKQVGERILSRTALIGDVLGYKPPVAGATPLSQEIWNRKKTIEDLLYRFNAWDTHEGDVKMKGASVGGSAFERPFLPEGPPIDKEGYVPNPGMSQPEPQNPLYKMMMDSMKTTFQLDDPKKGAIGFKSMWKDYMAYGSLAARMRTVNEGNAAAWRAEQATSPVTVDYLKRNGVANPYDYKQVRDFYNARRNEVAKVVLRTIKATEQRMDQLPQVRQMLGPNKHFTINMLDPNAPGMQVPEEDIAPSTAND